ncbi:iron-sulfur cluster assembly scaffold protein [Fundidesulfovibrio terrae]|uniref:iron-sulfur cluster assembly scaffold protein n=1 Tax=Fundidesulfovibrio terrae TaxID=2922866 RepID=UPI001FAF9623|nr:iron-sulfur cluster assembly scaffold protein [Fundidesulfovibrio terrae]
MATKRTYKNDGLVKPLEAFSAKAVYGSTFCKRPIAVQILVDDNVLREIGGEVQCSYSRQCLGTLISMVKGMDVDSAWEFSGEDLKGNLEYVDPQSDCDTYVVAAFRLALRNFEKGV